MIARSDIFSTPVWHENFPLPLVDELYDAAYRIKANTTEVANRSNQGGFQTKQFEWEEFHPQAKEYIKSVLEEIFKEHPEFRTEQSGSGKRSRRKRTRKRLYK